ncbi:MAG: exodeoxyribonuclease VII small subunit [Bacteroidales bacterium]
MAEKKISFNEAIKELENILEQIESGEPDVDELSGKVKRAAELIKICRKKLKSTEEEIDKILDEME